MTAQERLIATAKAEVGYLEKATNAELDGKTTNAGKKNYTKYARDLDAISGFYNGKKNGYDWCDVFVDWCFVQTFGKDTALALLCAPVKSCGAGCRYSAGYYKEKGQFHTENPQPGDQIFFGTAKTWQHTGIVVKTDGKYVYTIEGNTTGANGMVANGGGVSEKAYLLTYAKILGYGRPDWSIVEEPEEEAKEEAKEEPKAEVKKVNAAGNAFADFFDKRYARRYHVNALSGLNMRTDAGTGNRIIKALRFGDIFTCYGYYSKAEDGSVWLYGIDRTGKEGYCHKGYLA